MLPSIKLNTINDVPLSLEEEENMATNFCIEVNEYLSDNSRFDYSRLQWMIETIKEYEYDNNIIQSILNYNNLIETLENEVNDIMTKIDSQNFKKIQVFLSLIKTEKDIDFFNKWDLCQRIKEEF